MPEINPFKNPNFIKQISEEKNQGILPDPKNFEKISKNFNIEKLGSGVECFVVNDPENKEKAIAINYKDLSPEDARDIYYSSKIWNTLFPHNFPKIHAASAQIEENKFNGTIRQKISGKTLHEQNYSFKEMMMSDFKEKKSLLSFIKNIKNYLSDNDTNIKTEYPFSSALKEMEVLSTQPYNIPFFIDANTKNFIKDDDGNEYYVDTMRAGSRMTNDINIPAIENYMKEKGYSISDISKVSNSIRRLIAIFIEEN